MKWGIVSTIKAPADEILSYAAYHLEQGAHRLYLYLDEDNPEAYAALKAHAKIRVQTCDDAHWKRLGGKRPARHQVRQSRNATHAYTRRAEVDWLIHMDVDEFLWSGSSVADTLAALPADVLCARVRPAESLAGGDGTLFKAFIPNGPGRQTLVEQIYPTFGRHIRGGFLSHLAGKLFVRTGLPDMELRIHNIYRGDQMNPGEVELDAVTLCHRHTTSWEQWQAHYRFRLERGSYRAGLARARARDSGGMTLHELLSWLEAEEGTEGLRAFFDEVCSDSPDLRARLDRHGLLLRHDLDLEGHRARHFPKD